MLGALFTGQLLILVAQKTNNNMERYGNQHRHMHLNCLNYSLCVGVWFLMYAWNIIYRSIAYTGSPEH
jgi:hypothetical protein